MMWCREGDDECPVGFGFHSGIGGPAHSSETCLPLHVPIPLSLQLFQQFPLDPLLHSITAPSPSSGMLALTAACHVPPVRSKIDHHSGSSITIQGTMSAVTVIIAV